jgi:diguanylate cyclase (GGDEF)-like protein
MFDLDHFKRVNDTYGHLAGDQVLAQLGRLALGVLRIEDVFARYGGEEFGVIARSISLDQGGQLAERLRAQVEGTSFPIGGGQELRVTLSLGVCLWRPEHADAAQLIAAADEALYAAKRSGRNRYVLHGA